MYIWFFVVVVGNSISPEGQMKMNVTPLKKKQIKDLI